MKTVIRSRIRVAVLLAALPVALVPAWADDARPPSKAIPAALQPFVDSHSLAGAVTLVADKDKVLSLDAVGFSDVAARKPMKTDALFWIASQSKPITAAALIILVDEGKVKLDDSVEKYLPEFKGQMVAVEEEKGKVVLKKPKHPITVREVLRAGGQNSGGWEVANPKRKRGLDFPRSRFGLVGILSGSS